MGVRVGWKLGNEVCSFVVGDKTMPSHGDGVPAQIKVLQLLIWQMKDVGDVTHLDYIHEYLYKGLHPNT